MSTAHLNDTEDMDVVAIWLRRDPVRWMAGALAGLFAGVVAAAFGMLIATLLGAELWFPLKWMALPILGNGALESGFNVLSILVGFIVLEAVCMIQGIVHAHMTGTNSPAAVLGIGVVFGVFTWIFIVNLFLPSFTAIRAVGLPPSVAFPVCVVMGASLASVAFFDRVVRGRAL